MHKMAHVFHKYNGINCNFKMMWNFIKNCRKILRESVEGDAEQTEENTPRR